MNPLRRRRPADTNALSAALARGTLEDFLLHYRRSNVHWEGFASGPLLCQALGNNNLTGRVEISHRLLDDGARVDRGTPLHSLLARGKHDFDAEAVLLRRLLDAGADVNHVTARNGTPLETCAALFKFDDRTLTPFYDVLLDRPDIDFTRTSLGGRPVLVNLRKWYARRGYLVERVEDLMRERGQTVPGPTLGS